MKAYGDYISAGFIGSPCTKSSCRCCDGNYVKVGRAKNKKNNLRGLKKRARQKAKKEIKQEI